MSAAMNARLDLILTELRLPSIKRLALDLCEQSDREGWPGNRLLEALFEHEMNEREVRRIERRRTESALIPTSACRASTSPRCPACPRPR